MSLEHVPVDRSIAYIKCKNYVAAQVLLVKLRQACIHLGLAQTRAQTAAARAAGAGGTAADAAEAAEGEEGADAVPGGVPWESFSERIIV